MDNLEALKVKDKLVHEESPSLKKLLLHWRWRAVQRIFWRNRINFLGKFILEKQSHLLRETGKFYRLCTLKDHLKDKNAAKLAFSDKPNCALHNSAGFREKEGDILTIQTGCDVCDVATIYEAEKMGFAINEEILSKYVSYKKVHIAGSVYVYEEIPELTRYVIEQDSVNIRRRIASNKVNT